MNKWWIAYYMCFFCVLGYLVVWMVFFKPPSTVSCGGWKEPQLTAKEADTCRAISRQWKKERKDSEADRLSELKKWLKDWKP